MVLRRTLGDVEAVGYLTVGGARAHELGDLHLPFGEDLVSGAREALGRVPRPAQLGDDAGGDLAPRTVSSLLVFSIAETSSSGGVSFRR